MNFTIKNSSIEGQNGEYELLSTLGLFRKEPDPGPCKPSIFYLIDWIIQSDSGAIILIDGALMPVAEHRRTDILSMMGIEDFLIGA